MIIFIIFLATVVLDQVTKYLVLDNFNLGESIPIIQNIFHLTYVQNRGAAFGILQNQLPFFIIITLAVLALLFYFYRQLPLGSSWNKIALGMALGGTIGNFIDRVRLGFVVDFFDFRVWPVFNIADSAIVISVIIFSYWILIVDQGEE
ncbi:signal peptidase II [Orenia metallireducens]|uniref:Lipoprotein signal peptidase n=1 Tax=Orenia metallireducens TaxID=1413210 RepID=A0A1C0ABZ7_9FIRM|nr:signal peptidase II [Orenia metallireducens]OCL27913.1 signal peptidase II [Orenia metallireducens]